ncbi:hypothetical protein FGB62_312g012 [Gracilaria domingensis]|nr:hypothetical protein FGB62_312g012 [Gracilaria domingensis]
MEFYNAKENVDWYESMRARRRRRARAGAGHRPRAGPRRAARVVQHGGRRHLGGVCAALPRAPRARRRGRARGGRRDAGAVRRRALRRGVLQQGAAPPERARAGGVAAAAGAAAARRRRRAVPHAVAGRQGGVCAGHALPLLHAAALGGAAAGAAAAAQRGDVHGARRGRFVRGRAAQAGRQRCARVPRGAVCALRPSDGAAVGGCVAHA